MALKGFTAGAIDRIQQRRQTFNKNTSSLQRDTPEENIAELQKAVRDLQKAVDELQNAQMVIPDEKAVDVDGLPIHGAYCPILNGQYIRLSSIGVGLSVAIPHGLRRKPQGVIWTRNAAQGEILIEGRRSISVPPADKILVYGIHQGTVGEFSIGILF